MTDETPQLRAQPSATPRPRYWRAIVVGVLLLPLNVHWILVSELRWHIMLTQRPLFVTPVFFLFFVALLNMLIRRIAPRLAFSRGEMVIIYVMLVVSGTIATHDFLSNVMCSLPWPAWMATPENRWQQLIFPHLPRWLFVWDKELLAGYFNGNSSIYEPRVLLMWLTPLAIWSVVIFILGWTMLCFAALLRKAWMDDTKLSFPIVRLPMALVEENAPGSILRNPVFWTGFGVAAGCGILNGLSAVIPNMVHFETSSRMMLPLDNPPLSAAQPVILTFFPFSIGLAFLVPLDVSFSCWFFFLLSKAQSVFGYVMGYGTMVDFPFIHEQLIGGWLAFGVFLIYASRHHLANVLKAARGHGDGSDKGEAMSYRVAFWGMVVGATLFVIFYSMIGMNPLWAIAGIAIFLLVCMCITRARAESGAMHLINDLEPMNVFKLFGSNAVGPGNLAAAAMSHWYWRSNRSNMMPNFLEAFKLGQEGKLNYRALVFPILLVIVLSTVLGMWTSLNLFYTQGALAKCIGYQTYSGSEAYGFLGNALSQGLPPQMGRWWAIAAGSAMVILLSWLRTRFVGFPLHPIGYCLGPGLVYHWMPFMIAWAVKLLILRYGGLKLYRRAIPFFLGLILGDYLTGATWTLISVIWNVPFGEMWD